MAIKHNTAAPNTAPAAGTTVGGTTWNEAHKLDTDGFDIPGTTAPAAPAAGNVRIFGRNVAGVPMAASIDETGYVTTLQTHIGRNKLGYWTSVGNTASGPVSAVGFPAPSYSGSPTQRNVSTTNLANSTRRIGVVSAATAGSISRATPGVVQFWRGAGFGQGGFRAFFRWVCSDAATVSGARTFVGMANTASVGNIDPSTLLNSVGVCTDGGDNTFYFMSNDGAGNATKVACGANFPDHTLTADVYELALYCPPNGSMIGAQLTRLNTGDTTSTTFTTDLPVNTTLLCPQFMRNNNATALAVGIDVISMHIETDS